MLTMKPKWPMIGTLSVVGLLLTGGGIFWLIYTGWDEVTILCFLIGSFFLLSSLVMTFFSLWVARVDISHLPEDWRNLSDKERHDFARKRVREESRKGNKSARVALWILRLRDAQTHQMEEESPEKEN